MVGYVAIGKYDFLDGFFLYPPFQFGFAANRDSSGVTVAGQLRWIISLFDVGDLRSREGDNVGLVIVSITGIEYVEISSTGTHNEDTFRSVDGIAPSQLFKRSATRP